MAEAAIGTAIVQQVGSEIIKHMGSAAWKKIMFGSDLETQLDGLREMKSFIEAALRNKDPFEVSTDVEGHKIQKLRAVNNRLGYLLDEVAARTTRQEVMGGNWLVKEVRLFFSSSNQLATSRSTAQKIKCIRKELESIKTAYDMVNSISSSVGNPKRGFSQHDCSLTTKVIGRDRDRDHIICQLCDSSNAQELVSVAAIVGIGGQGKSTLAWYVCNDERVKACFDIQVWVPSSSYSSFSDIINKVIKDGTENADPFNSGMPQLHPQVLNRFVGKKCLLVLDNIWYQDNVRSDWHNLKNFLQVGGAWAAGIKVLVTARSEKVARIMDVGSPYTLDGLDKSDALLLLQECARQQGQIPNGAEAIEKEIIRLIPNVPLVIKNIGCQLGMKDNIRQWEEFKDQLASKPAIELNNDVMQKLKLSYDQLDEELKRCVVYCCLFPDTCFNRYEMILYWIALGFVEIENKKSLEEEGEEYVHRLVRHGFLLEDKGDESHFSIHDVMHELLAFIGKSKHQMIDSTTKEITQGVSHVSLCLDGDDVEDVPLSKLKDGQSLESILILRSRAPINVRLGLRIEKLASTFPHLKVLNLKDQGIEKVPSSIEELIHLRHLDLSRNLLCKLPNSITKLVNLMSLILTNCVYLQELPRDMGKLMKLRHLRIWGTNLRRMPKGFGSLLELRTLDMFVVEGKKGSVGAKLGELGHLGNLKGELSIVVNGESKYVVSEARNAHMEKKRGLTDLIIAFKERALEDEMCLEGLQPSGENLKRLTIRNYGGKKLPTWMKDDRFHERFPKLQHCGFGHHVIDDVFLWIENNEKDLLEWVPGYSRLMEQLKTGPIQLHLEMRGGNGPPSLRDTALGSATLIIDATLIIEKQLEPRSGGGNDQDILLKACFPILHTLILKDIPELEVLPEEFRDHSSLKILRIYDCPKLKELPRWIGSFSSLEELSIAGATQLKTLPDSIGNLTSLKKLSIKGATQLKILLDSIGSLTSLENLSIQGATQLKTLPDSIGSLTSLEKLSIQGATQLKTLPDSIGSLTSLKELSIKGATQLKTLPDSIGSITSLEKLSIKGATQLKTLPDSIGSLTSFKRLSIKGCTQLKTLPIGSLTSLKKNCLLKGLHN